MKIKDLVKKYSKRDSKGSHSPKVDGKLLWFGKKVSGGRKMLKKELNLLKPNVSNQDGGDEIILTAKTSLIVVHSKLLDNKCTLKISTPKGLTLNQCLEKCNYLMKFIAINAWLWDAIDGKDKYEDYLKKSKFKSYQVYRNYFIINV
jgi:hypothetical protein